MAAFLTPTETALSRSEQLLVTLRTGTPVVHAFYQPSFTQTSLPPSPGHQAIGFAVFQTGFLAAIVFLLLALVTVPFVMGFRLRDMCTIPIEHMISRLSAPLSSVCYAIQAMTLREISLLPRVILAKGCTLVTSSLTRTACSYLNLVPKDQYLRTIKDNEELQNRIDTVEQARLNSRVRRKLEISKQATATSYLNHRLSASSLRTKRLTQEKDDVEVTNTTLVNDKRNLTARIDGLNQDVTAVQRAKDTAASGHKEELKAKDIVIFQTRLQLWLKQVTGRELETRINRMATQKEAQSATIDRLTERVTALEKEKDATAATQAAEADGKALELSKLKAQLSTEKANIEYLRGKDEATSAENATLRATVARLEGAAVVAATAKTVSDSNVELLKKQLAAKSDEVERLTRDLQASPASLGLETRKRQIAESLRAANAMLSNAASAGSAPLGQRFLGLAHGADRLVTTHEPLQLVCANNGSRELSALSERKVSIAGPRHHRQASLSSAWNEFTPSRGSSGTRMDDDEHITQMPLSGRRRERTVPSGWRFGVQSATGPQTAEEPLESEGANEGFEELLSTAHSRPHVTFPSLWRSTEANLVQLPVAPPLSPPYTPFGPFAGALPRIDNDSSSVTTSNIRGSLHSTEHEPLGLQLITTPIGQNNFIPPTTADGRIRVLTRSTNTTKSLVEPRNAGPPPPQNRPRLNLTGVLSRRLLGSMVKATQASNDPL